MGYTKVVKGDGGIALYLKTLNTRLSYGVSVSKGPEGFWVAIGLLDAEILATMAKVEKWKEHNFIGVDFTYKEPITTNYLASLKGDSIADVVEKLLKKLSYFEEHINEISEDYIQSLSDFDVPDYYDSKSYGKENMIGLYYGILNLVISDKLDNLEDILRQKLTTKTPDANFVYKIDLILKYLSSD